MTTDAEILNTLLPQNSSLETQDHKSLSKTFEYRDLKAGSYLRMASVNNKLQPERPR